MVQFSNRRSSCAAVLGGGPSSYFSALLRFTRIDVDFMVAQMNTSLLRRAWRRAICTNLHERRNASLIRRGLLYSRVTRPRVHADWYAVDSAPLAGASSNCCADSRNMRMNTVDSGSRWSVSRDQWNTPAWTTVHPREEIYAVCPQVLSSRRLLPRISL